MKSIDRAGLAEDKTFLLRVDLNAPLGDAENIRFHRAARTISYLQKSGTKVLVLAHYGRPLSQNRSYSLLPYAGLLSKLCLESVVFIESLDLSDAREILMRGSGGVFLLENLRFFEGEDANDDGFAEELASLGDIYVNDAFSVSHRKHASIVAITKYLPKFAGPNLLKEVEMLGNVFKQERRPLTLVIGGAKVGDKLHFLENIVLKADNILLGGGAANTFLAAEEGEIGESISDLSVLPHIKPFLEDKRFVKPSDYVWEGNRILDIGKKTQLEYAEIIKNSGTVIWSGPMGNIEKRKFQSGSEAVARAIAESGSYSIVGGGDTTSLVTSLGLSDQVSFLSTGGSAMLQFLELGTLPGIEALE